MADKNVNPSRDEIQKLECPFTWITKDIAKGDDKEYHLNDDEESFPLLRLMRCIMTVYVDTKAKTKSDEILNGLKKCTEIMATLKENEHPEISVAVVRYVLQSTKCFVYEQLNLPERLRQIFSKIKQDWKMNNKERSTLIACKSICWSKYHRMGTAEAEHFIRDAIKENPNCELWYFVLGKNLRRKRRDSAFASSPSKEEIRNFEKAYNMSKNPLFGIFLAQMYREAKMMKEATSMYYKIYVHNPTATTILLRLALGFIRLKDFPKAKECLDKVEALTPSHSMYLHYRGVYYMNLRNYEEAATFLKEASKDNCIPAERQYLDCITRLDRSFDVIKYLHNMVNKYTHLPKEQTQPLLLDLALAYWLKKRDVPNTLKYFIRAVEINPEAICFTNYFSTHALWVGERNLYHVLNRDVLPIVFRNKGQFEKSSIDEAEKLKKHCDEHFAKNYSNALNSFSEFNLRN